MFYVIEAVRMTHKHVSDAEIGENISKWLAQAPVRIERAKYVFTGYSFYTGCPKMNGQPVEDTNSAILIKILIKEDRRITERFTPA